MKKQELNEDEKDKIVSRLLGNERKWNPDKETLMEWRGRMYGNSPLGKELMTWAAKVGKQVG